MQITDQQLVRCPCCGETFILQPAHLIAAAAAEPGPTPPSTAQVNTPLKPVQVMFDGGSIGNPGPGYGSYQLVVNGHPRKPRRIELGPGYTNNEAEYDTLIAALEKLFELAKEPETLSLEIRGDSKLVINQINRVWKVKEPRMQQRVAKVWALLEPLGKWTAIWHPRERSVEAFGH